MLAGAVLTGGSSRRMGSNKALLDVGGTPMARRVLQSLRSAGCAPVVLVGGDAGALGALGARIVDDVAPGEGPAGGIISALRALDGSERVVVVSCDLPYLLAEHLRPLIEAMDRAGDVVEVAVATADRVQPLCALWRRSALPAVEAAFSSGVRSVHGLLDVVRVIEVPVPAEGLRNVNTLSDLEGADLPGSDGEGSDLQGSDLEPGPVRH